MKIILQILPVLFVMTAGEEFAFAQDSLSKPDSVNSCYLSVNSNFNDAGVYVDGSYAGITPLKDYKLSIGAHKIMVTNPNSFRVWHGESEFREIVIESDTTLYIPFRYYYFFQTEPSDAKAFSGDSLLGFTPLRIFRTDSLTGNVEFRKKGYMSFLYDMKQYDFTKGAEIRLQASPVVTPDEIVYKDRGTQFKTKRSLPAIAGLSVAVLGTCYSALTFKNRANSEYNAYLLTGNTLNYDRSNSYDTYFVVSLILMQAAIGGLIYFLFFDK